MWVSSRIQTLLEILGDCSRRTFQETILLLSDWTLMWEPLKFPWRSNSYRMTDWYFEHHTSLSMNSNVIGAQVWKVPSTRVSSYLQSLREKGVASHFWVWRWYKYCTSSEITSWICCMSGQLAFPMESSSNKRYLGYHLFHSTLLLRSYGWGDH